MFFSKYFRNLCSFNKNNWNPALILFHVFQTYHYFYNFVLNRQL